MSSAPVTIHVGYHKAASSFLQTLLFPALDASFQALDQRQLDYISLSDDFSPETFRGFFDGGPDAAPLVLSNECLSGVPRQLHGLHDEARIAPRLQAAYPRARILLIVREQYDYLLSVYGFYVCITGATRASFPRWLREQLELGILDKIRYDGLVSMYQQLYPPEAVRVVPFELLKRAPEQFLQQILEATGLRLREGAQVELSKRVLQGSRLYYMLLATRALNILYYPFEVLKGLGFQRLNRFTIRGWAGLRQRTTNPLLRRVFAGTRKVQIPDWFRSSCDPAIRRSNQRLAQLTGLDLGSLGYTV